MINYTLLEQVTLELSYEISILSKVADKNFSIKTRKPN